MTTIAGSTGVRIDASRLSNLQSTCAAHPSRGGHQTGWGRAEISNAETGFRASTPRIVASLEGGLPRGEMAQP